MSTSECLCLLHPTPDTRHECAFGSWEVQCGRRARGIWILNRVEDDDSGVEDGGNGAEDDGGAVLGCALLSPTYRPGSYVIPGPELRHPRPRSGIQMSASECF